MSLKLPNGVFAGELLPENLQGSNQVPDYLWPVYHEFLGEEWSVASGSSHLWCDCVGEGKPTDVPLDDENDHALNQVIMSAVACIYFQISLGKLDPQVLAFTLNKTIVRFFIVVGEKKIDRQGKESWGENYYHVEDRDLDLMNIRDCICCLTLGRCFEIGICPSWRNSRS